MAYQEVKTTGYGQKVGDSLKGLYRGPLLILLATILIFLNENRSIKQYKANDRAQDVCVEMDVNQVNPEFDGKTVHCVGIATTDETLSEPNFGIAVNAFKLNRDVAYYQWVEKTKTESKEKIGGKTEIVTTYYYEKQWVKTPQGNSFKDPAFTGENFVYVKIEPQSQVVKSASLGVYQLPDIAISRISGNEDVDVEIDSTLRSEWNASIKKTLGVPADAAVDYVNTNRNEVYFGQSPNNPQVGDVRVTFSNVPNNKPISMIATVSGNTFKEHVDSKNGKSVFSVTMGNSSSEEMVSDINRSNKIYTWLVRAICLLLAIVGFKLLLSITTVLFKLVPFLGKVATKMVGFISSILGSVWTLVFIGIAWVVVRPVLSVCLLVAVAGLIVFFVIRGKQKRAELEANAPAEVDNPNA